MTAPAIRHSRGQSIPRSLSRLFFVAGTLLCVPLTASAQDNGSGPAGAKEIEEIIVTGTRISRRDFSSISPIATLELTDIEFSGHATVEELLNKMPQVAPDMGRSSNNPGNGSANINLRGMGANRTLILLNGRRVAPSGAGSLVDVNNLPQALMSRVEIITGGASAIYGSDAMSGVVNFITRNDFDGAAIETKASITEEGDAEDYDISLIYGLDLPNGNVTGYFNFHERKPLFASERELTSVVWWDPWVGTELLQWGSATVPAGQVTAPRIDWGSGLARTTFNMDGTPREWLDPEDRYNYQTTNYLQVPLTRYTGGIFGNLDVGDRFNAYTEVFFARNEVEQTLAPVPASFVANVNTDNPLLAPATRTLFENNFLTAPGMAQFRFSRRMTEVGPRIISSEKEYWRGVLGLKGDLFDGWAMDTWVIYTQSDEKESIQNGVSRSRFLQALLVDPLTNMCTDPSNGCVPVNPFGEGRISDEAVNYLRFQAITNLTERTQITASTVVTGSPMELWAGPLDLAVGIDWRSDEARYNADPSLSTDDALGLTADSSVEGTENVTEIYVESLLPLAIDETWAEYMAIEAAVRYSLYDNAGDVWTYKIGGEWELFPELRIRAMQQRSVRAPNNRELFSKQIETDWFFVGALTSNDPCSASADPVGNGNVDKCISQGLDPLQIGTFEATSFYTTKFLGGGNPDLQPEASDTLTFGGVFQPELVPGLTISVDYFKIEIEDTIGEINAALICFDPLNSQALFCNNLRRDGTGNVSEIAEIIQNRGKLRTSGVDTQVRYAADLPDRFAAFDGVATLTISSIWAHMMENEFQENPVTTVIDCSGRFGWPCDFATQFGSLSQEKVTTNFHYASGPLQAHLTWRYVGRAHNAAQIGADLFGWGKVNPVVDQVDPHHYLDLGLSWGFNEDTTLRLGINNLTNQGPPNLANASWANNTDTGVYDVFGRTWVLSLSARF